MLKNCILLFDVLEERTKLIATSFSGPTILISLLANPANLIPESIHLFDIEHDFSVHLINLIS
jgi:hypothetical protein